MKILYIGHATPKSTSRHRADALIRLGHNVILADPYAAHSSYLQGRFLGALHYRTGYRLLQNIVCSWVDKLLKGYADWPDIIWVDSGELIGANAATKLLQFGGLMVLYNVDDPSGHRDGRRWDSLLSALPAYDLCVVVREENVKEFYDLGARNVQRVWRSYDEIQHRPFDCDEDIASDFRSDVAFIGTWMPNERRDNFVLSLLKLGVPLSIWGDAWDRAPNWLHIKHCWRGHSIYGREYVAAIQGSKIAIGMLSKGNRDLHTQRSSEIPFASGLLCAERTSEHQQMYKEGIEAFFWDNADECAEICHSILSDDNLRQEIRANGHLRVQTGGFGNESTLSLIIEKLLDCKGMDGRG